MSTTSLHALRRQEVFEAFQTSPAGLTAGEVIARRSLYGPNRIADVQTESPVKKWLATVAHPMAMLLWVSGLVALFLGRYELGIVIWIVVIVNAGFSYWREYRASQVVAGLKQMLPVYARVIRNGQEEKICAEEIVPGDVIIFAEGENIPADARLIEAYGLRTNNSTLTGEALPAIKTADPSLRGDLTEIERPNLVFGGTSVVSGTGSAVVFATGRTSQFGRIANLTHTAKEEPSLLQAQIGRIIRYLSWIGFGIGLCVFFLGITEMGLTIDMSLILAIGILVAAVPEGLLPTVTLSLAMAVQRLAQRGVLVKKLSVVETLGLTSIICTDKSGTLTQNQMTVRAIWAAGVQYDVTGVGYEPHGNIQPSDGLLPQRPTEASPHDLGELLKAAILCNNSRLIPPSPGHPIWTSLGDQTEAALRVLALKGGVDEAAIAKAFPRVHEIPFDARRKRMSTIHKQQGRLIAYVKGAPREMLQLCTHIRKQNGSALLDDEMRAEILAANDDFAHSAMRVLALAKRDIPTRPDTYTSENIEQQMTFLGLVGMMDPPRTEVAQAMHDFRTADIRLVMVTGDYGLTAESVARRVGMLKTSSPRILTGADLDGLSDTALQDILDEEVIFSRMAPEHKLRVVGAYQDRNEVVAVIGDGVNDTPALRKADIGIAMGIGGTDVAREAADVVLVDDNFTSIPLAIAEGRAVYDNLRKFITYIFASNIPEIIPFILRAFFDLPLALTVSQILAIDLGTDLLPALALGVDKPEPGILLRPPRKRDQAIVDHLLLRRAFLWLGGIETILAYSGFFLVYNLLGFPIVIEGWTLILSGHPLPHVTIIATTVFHAGVVMAQVGNVFACRSETANVRHLGWFSNRYLLAGVAIEIGMLVWTVYDKPMATLFEHAPLPAIYWAGLILYAPILYGLERGRKSLVRRIQRKKHLVKEGVTI